MSYCNATSDSDSLEPRDRTRFLIAWSERTSLVWTQKHNTHGNTSGTEDTGVASIGDHLTPPEWIKIRSNQSAPISQLGQQSWGSKMGAERVVIVFWIPGMSVFTVLHWIVWLFQLRLDWEWRCFQTWSYHRAPALPGDLLTFSQNPHHQRQLFCIIWWCSWDPHQFNWNSAGFLLQESW